MTTPPLFARLTGKKPDEWLNNNLSTVTLADIFDRACIVNGAGDHHHVYTALERHPVALEQYIYRHVGSISFDDNLFLRWTAYHGELETMKYLQQHGADLSVRNGDCAITAATQGHVPILQYLHKHGHLLPHARHCANNAAMYGQSDVLAFMLRATPETVLNANTIISAAMWGRIDMMIWLRDHGADLAAAAQKCASFAIHCGEIETVDWMLAEKLPVNIAALSFHARIGTPFHGHLKSLQWLENRGNPIEYDNLICVAAHYGHEDIVQWCHQRGAHIPFNESCRLLKKAEGNGHEKIAAIMREQINRNARDIVAAATNDEPSVVNGTTADRFHHFLQKLGR